MKTCADYAIDTVIFITVIFAFICGAAAFITMNSSSAVAAKNVRAELTGCDKFLNNSSECLYSFANPSFANINKQLNFKSANHRGAFWLGFSFSNYLGCPAFVPAFKGSAAPKDLFNEYFSKNIDIGDGALQRGKDEPYALAYFAGEGLFFELGDTFDQKILCDIIYEAMGPRGKVATLLKASP